MDQADRLFDLLSSIFRSRRGQELLLFLDTDSLKNTTQYS